jgi:hypothetical protein
MSEVFHAQGATAANAYDDLNRIQSYYRGWMNAGSGTTSSPYDSSVTQGPIVIDSNNDTVPAQYESVDSFTPNSQTGDYNQKLGTTPDLPNGNVFQEPAPSSSTTYSSLGNEDQQNERDMFLQFDPFGELANQSQSYLASNGSGGYDFVGTYQNGYQYDALGRRISETTTTRHGVIETTDLFYDASGNVIQDSNPPNGGSVNVVNQYVWCPVESGMTILRDSKEMGETNVWGVPASGLNLRMYVSQGPDGSVWEITGANTSSPAFFTEQYVYGRTKGDANHCFQFATPLILPGGERKSDTL